MDLKKRARAKQKSSGRKKVMPNKLKAEAVKAAASASDPLYMLSVINDPCASTELRLAMAAKALPYFHNRLRSVKPPRPAPDLPEVKIRYVDLEGNEISHPSSTESDKN
jgi:hypothetical protein